MCVCLYTGIKYEYNRRLKYLTFNIEEKEQISLYAFPHFYCRHTLFRYWCVRLPAWAFAVYVFVLHSPSMSTPMCFSVLGNLFNLARLIGS